MELKDTLKLLLYEHFINPIKDNTTFPSYLPLGTIMNIKTLTKKEGKGKKKKERYL